VSALAALVLSIAALFVQGPAGIPKNDGWVTDLADLLPAARETALEARMESYRTGSSHAEIAVLTVPSLNGEPVEKFALETGRAWGIGSKASSNGALLVVARDEHEVRIEVGRGLEGDVPDAVAWSIIQKVIVPKFRAGDFAGGIEEGITALHKAIGGDYGPIGGRPQKRRSSGVGISLFLLFLIIAARNARRRGRGFFPPTGGRYRGLGFPLGMGLGGLGGGGGGGGGFSGGGFGGFGGGGGFSGGGASGRW